MEQLMKVIAADIIATSKQYEECCNQHHFIEAASLREILTFQRKYLGILQDKQKPGKVEQAQVDSARKIAFGV